MKNFKPFPLVFLAILFLLITSASVSAQKFAYVDTEYILQNLPEFTDAQNQLDEMSQEWQKEIEAKFAKVDEMYKKYQADAILLPEDMKKKREEEIIQAERSAKDLQKQRFGKDGDLFKKRQELVKPVQERVYNAIQEIATKKNYSFVFDKSGGVTLMYVDPKFDISDEVLAQIGSIMTTKDSENPKK